MRAAGAARHHSGAMSTERVHRRSGSSVSVLVVETVPLLAARLFRVALLFEGMSVSLAETFPDALSRLQAGDFDVLLVDVDGMKWPALGELAALRTAAPGALLIALTAERQPEVTDACRAQGADRVLDVDEVWAELRWLTERL